MPIRNAPSKIPIVGYVTVVEKSELEMLAKAAQLTLSEYIRELCVRAIAAFNQSPITMQAPAPAAQPRARDLLKDFQFGDINESTDESEQ